MTGLIWFVQIVHYPLHGEVGSVNFSTVPRVARPVDWFCSDASNVARARNLPLFSTERIRRNSIMGLVAGMGLLAIVWASTGLLQVPAHNALMNSFSEANHQKLVFSNWIRTIGWTARQVFYCGFVGLLDRT